jgi:hypothetical protein
MTVRTGQTGQDADGTGQLDSHGMMPGQHKENRAKHDSKDSTA